MSLERRPRKGVILDFIGRFSLWAQYSEGRYAINEWEIIAYDCRIEMADGGSEIRLYFIEPRSVRTLPNRCEDCIDTLGISTTWAFAPPAHSRMTIKRTTIARLATGENGIYYTSSSAIVPIAAQKKGAASSNRAAPFFD